jgi:hypothetical protein
MRDFQRKKLMPVVGNLRTFYTRIRSRQRLNADARSIIQRAALTEKKTKQNLEKYVQKWHF